MSALREQHCATSTAGMSLLNKDEIRDYQAHVDSDWHISKHGNGIERLVRFNNYYDTMSFVNAVAWIAHAENHHPQLLVEYNRCQISYSTHDLGGLTENDYICAAKIDALLE